jgi:hypothetical protein
VRSLTRSHAAYLRHICRNDDDCGIPGDTAVRQSDGFFRNAKIF